MSHRYSHIENVLGETLFERIRNSKILVVGAGGIGCELLKNLVLTGFENIEIIDLDTIDVSNLNRQFLFREKHVGKPKSLVAKESVFPFNPKCNIKAHHGNIKSSQFGPAYYEGFTIVMNALDNVDARKHVNRMCLASNIPLIDGGTAGYLGQVTTIKKGDTECYECTPKMTQKSFAVCTIRSNPSTPVHCVVWAKLLFERLFGKADDANAVADFEDIMKSEDKVEERVFCKVFNLDIEEAKNMKNESVWSAGKPPKSLDLHNILSNQEIKNATRDDEHHNGEILKEQIIWSLKQNAQTFIESVKQLRELRKRQGGNDLTFDKDDDIALNFVTAAANLRATNFHIENKSKFDVKAIAGNIVPAIATTNAIIAGMMVMESIKVLNNRISDCRMVHCVRKPSMVKRKPCLLYPVSLSTPNPSCFICSSNFITITLNCSKTTLGYFVDEILCKRLSLQEPMINVGDALIYEGGDDLDDDEDMKHNLVKTLDRIHLSHNTVATIEDFREDINWKVTLIHDEKKEIEDFEICGTSEQTKQRNGCTNGSSSEATHPNSTTKATPTTSTATSTASVQSGLKPQNIMDDGLITIEEEVDNDLLVIEDEQTISKMKEKKGTKRRREVDDENGGDAKGEADLDVQESVTKKNRRIK